MDLGLTGPGTPGNGPPCGGGVRVPGPRHVVLSVAKDGHRKRGRSHPTLLPETRRVVQFRVPRPSIRRAASLLTGQRKWRHFSCTVHRGRPRRCSGRLSMRGSARPPYQERAEVAGVSPRRHSQGVHGFGLCIPENESDSNPGQRKCHLRLT